MDIVSLLSVLKIEICKVNNLCHTHPFLPISCNLCSGGLLVSCFFVVAYCYHYVTIKITQSPLNCENHVIHRIKIESKNRIQVKLLKSFFFQIVTFWRKESFIMYLFTFFMSFYCQRLKCQLVLIYDINSKVKIKVICLVLWRDFKITNKSIIF